MHRIAKVLGPSLPVLAGAACLAGTLHASPDLSAHALLDAYDRGDYRTVVVNLPARREALSTFAHDLEDATVTWISNAPADVQVRRRLIAATVALEAARGFALRPDPARMTERQWQDRQRLLEWACRLVRQTNPPSEAERWWQLASVALVEQSYGYPFYAFAGAWDDAREHLAHASARFPGEPRLALAKAVVAEESAGLVGYALDGLPNAPLDQPRYDVRVRDMPGASLDLVLSQPLAPRPTPPAGRVPMAAARRGGAPNGPRTFPTDALDFRVPLREAVRAYGALLTRDGIGAEAQLHVGAIEISLDQPDLALPHLDAALQGLSDPVMQYAVQFYRAAALTRLGQVQDAEIAFRAALGVSPHAESATVGLAWLLTLNQHRAEASELVGGELTAASSDRGSDLATALDPLAIYALGDARLWDADIRHLRAALAKPFAPPLSKPASEPPSRP